MSDLPKVSPIHDYWTTPKAASGDSDSAPLFQSVGQCITAWERLEASFASLFSLLCDDKSQAATAMYGNLGNTRAKIEAFRLIIEPAFDKRKVPENERSCLALLLRHFLSASPRRNDIAHGMVMGFTINDKSMGNLLVPPWYAHKKTREKVDTRTLMLDDLESMVAHYSYRYTRADIDALTSKFMHFRQWVNDYVHFYNDKYLRPEMIADLMRQQTQIHGIAR